MCVPTRRIINGNVICSVKSFEDYLTIIKFGFKLFQKKSEAHETWSTQHNEWACSWQRREILACVLGGNAICSWSKNLSRDWVMSEVGHLGKKCNWGPVSHSLHMWNWRLFADCGPFIIVVAIQRKWRPSKYCGGRLNVTVAIRRLNRLSETFFCHLNWVPGIQMLWLPEWRQYGCHQVINMAPICPAVDKLASV